MHIPRLKRWLHRIDRPTLLLWGAQDGIVTPSYGDGLRQEIPDARIDIIPAVGHFRANSSRAAGPTPPIKGRFHRRSDEFLESIKKGVETPEKGRNAGPPGSSRGRGYKNQRINPMH